MELFKKDGGLINDMIKSIFMTLTQSIITNLIFKNLFPSISNLIVKFNVIKISLQFKVIITLLISGIVLFVIYQIYIYFFKNKKHKHKCSSSSINITSLSSFSSDPNEFELDPKKVKKSFLKNKNLKKHFSKPDKKKLSYESLISSC